MQNNDLFMKINCFLFISFIFALPATQFVYSDAYTHPVYPSCGAMSLVITANEIGIPLTYKELEDKTLLNTGILSFHDLIDAGNKLGIKLAAVKGGKAEILKTPAPIIVAVTPEHFQVITNAIPSKVDLIDNSGIKEQLTWNSFISTFRNAALILEDINTTIQNKSPKRFNFYATEADFGWVSQNPEITYSFRGKNWSEAPVTILPYQTSCNCTSLVIEPETAEYCEEIVVKVNVKKTIATGKIHEHALVKVVYNDEHEEIVQLSINAFTGSPLSFDPSEIYESIKLGEKLDNQIIRWDSVQPTEVNNWTIISAKNHIDSKIFSSQIRNNDILLRFDPPKTVGFYKDYLDINLTRNSGHKTFVQIPITIEIHSDIIVDIPNISFGILNKNQGKEQEITFRSISSQLFSIDSFQSDLPIKAIFSKKKANQQKVYIKISGHDFMENKIYNSDILFRFSEDKKMQECKVYFKFLYNN